MIGFTATVSRASDIREWTQRMPDGFHRRAGMLLTSYALRIEREAKRAAPVRANILKPSIHTDINIGPQIMQARIGTDVKHGLYQEHGTGLWGPKKRPYEIRPKNKKALAFPVQAATEFSGGKLGRAMYVRAGRSRRGGRRLTTSARQADQIVRRKVIHPGIRPRPFLGPAFQRLAPQFQRDLAQIAARFNFPGAGGRATPAMGPSESRRLRSRWM